mmetsp:Transcript_30819/g.47221  ORF Transcript_30819/g.47221 Transcript_30819/m.47221 type:complete len:144 (+) Transcript_30819:446-877(+)
MEEMSMPPLSQHTRHTKYNSHVPSTYKNKYGLDVKQEKPPKIPRLSLAHSVVDDMSVALSGVAPQRKTLQERYCLPEDLLEKKVGFNNYNELRGGASSLYNLGEEIEPFGWRIGLKQRSDFFHVEQERLKKERQVQQLKNQKR